MQIPLLEEEWEISFELSFYLLQSCETSKCNTSWLLDDQTHVAVTEAGMLDVCKTFSGKYSNLK